MAKKKQPEKPKSLLNSKQFESLRPYFPVIKQYHLNKVWVGGDTQVIAGVHLDSGLGFVDQWCASCMGDALDAIYTELIRFDETALEF